MESVLNESNKSSIKIELTEHENGTVEGRASGVQVIAPSVPDACLKLLGAMGFPIEQYLRRLQFEEERQVIDYALLKTDYNGLLAHMQAIHNSLWKWLGTTDPKLKQVRVEMLLTLLEEWPKGRTT